MTRPNQRRVMDRIYSRAPTGDEYPIEFMPAGPTDRGHVGRVLIRARNGSTPSLRDLWWLRCPWCREMVEVPRERLSVEAGKVRIDGTIVCGHCEAVYVVDAGRAKRVPGVEGAGHSAVTSDPLGASTKEDSR